MTAATGTQERRANASDVLVATAQRPLCSGRDCRICINGSMETLPQSSASFTSWSQRHRSGVAAPSSRPRHAVLRQGLLRRHPISFFLKVDMEGALAATSRSEDPEVSLVQEVDDHPIEHAVTRRLLRRTASSMRCGHCVCSHHRAWCIGPVGLGRRQRSRPWDIGYQFGYWECRWCSRSLSVHALLDPVCVDCVNRL